MNSGNPGNENELHAVLFPHSGLSEEGFGRVLSFLDSLTVLLPWHMEQPGVEWEETGLVQVVKAPEPLKPMPGFKGLLSEYRNWMSQNDFKGYTPLLRASLGESSGEPTAGEIREALRPGEPRAGSDGGDDATRWHLVLHLNRSVEEQEEEADRVLRALRQGTSPLRGLVEEEETDGILRDLPPFEASPLTEPHHLEPVCEAWLGLFGASLGREDLLVTLNRSLLDHLSALWEERDGGNGLMPGTVTWSWPDLSPLGPEGLVPERARVLRDPGGAGEIRKLLAGFLKDQARGLAALEKQAGALDPSWMRRYSQGELRLTVRTFPAHSEVGHGRKGRILELVQGRAVLLVEEARRHENP